MMWKDGENLESNVAVLIALNPLNVGPFGAVAGNSPATSFSKIRWGCTVKLEKTNGKVQLLALHVYSTVLASYEHPIGLVNISGTNVTITKH